MTTIKKDLPLIATLPQCVLTLIAIHPVQMVAIELEGFTEPNRTINVAATESGSIAEILVREGDRVEAETPLARLDTEVQQALLAIAEQGMQSEGRLDAARAELQLHQQRLEKLEILRPADMRGRRKSIVPSRKSVLPKRTFVRPPKIC